MMNMNFRNFPSSDMVEPVRPKVLHVETAQRAIFL